MPRNSPVKIFTFLIFLTFLLAGCVNINEIEQPDNIKAGTVLKSIVHISISATKDVKKTHFILALLVPRPWTDVYKAQITYHSDIGNGEMEPLAANALVAGTKSNWPTVIAAEYGTVDNALQDMMWVVYQTKKTFDVRNNQHLNGQIVVKYKVGPSNTKVKLAYVVAGSASGSSTGSMACYSKLVNVTGGEAPTIDYVEPQLVSMTPTAGKVRGSLTVSYHGNAGKNVLSKAHQIYLCSTAYTVDGQTIVNSSRNSDSRFIPMGNNLWRFSFNPNAYYKLKTSSIKRIEYYLSNGSGDIMLGARAGKSPFIYQFK